MKKALIFYMLFIFASANLYSQQSFEDVHFKGFSNGAMVPNPSNGSHFDPLDSAIVYEVNLSPEAQRGVALCGDTLWYELVLENTGTTADSYFIKVVGNAWTTNVYLDGVIVDTTELIDGLSDTILRVEVILPPPPCGSTQDEAFIIAISLHDTTACDTAIVKSVSGCFFFESFEDSFPPTSWTTQVESWDGTGSEPEWSQVDSTTTNPACVPQEGEFMANFNSATCSAGDIAVLKTPIVDISVVPIAPRLAFWMYYAYSFGFNDKLIVVGSNDSGSVFGDTLSNIKISDKGAGNDGWFRETINLPPAYIGSPGVQFKFIGVSDSGYNINVDLITLCMPANHDIAVTELILPAPPVFMDSTYQVDMVVQNLTATPELLYLRFCQATDGYSVVDTNIMILDGLSTDTLTLSEDWTPAVAGTVVFNAWTNMASDINHANDTLAPPESMFVMEFPRIVINEIMQNPADVGDADGEWFELYNAGTQAVDINGWVFYDLDYDRDTVISGTPVIIYPDSYFVMGCNAELATNGSVYVDYEYAWGDFTLANSSDEVFLENQYGNIIDSLLYDDGATFPDPNGASMELIAPSLDNNIGLNWMEAALPWASGDLGSPGMPNTPYPRIVADPDYVDFMSFFIGDTVDSFIQVCNAGRDTLFITYIYPTDDSNFSFIWDQITDSLLPGECDTLITIFHPGIIGSLSSISAVVSNDPNEELDSVVLTLKGFCRQTYRWDFYKVPPHTAGAFIIDSTTYTGVSELHLEFDHGSEHSIGVTSPNNTTDIRYYYDYWSDGGSQIHDIGPITTTGACTSYYDVSYHCMVTKNPYQEKGFIMVDSTWYDSTGIIQFWWSGGSNHILEVSRFDSLGTIEFAFDYWAMDSSEDTLSDSIWVWVDSITGPTNFEAYYNTIAIASCSLAINTDWTMDSIDVNELRTMVDGEVIEINNNGNFKLDFSLHIFSSGDWTPATNPGYDQFSLKAQFNDYPTAPSIFSTLDDNVSTTPTWATDVIFGDGGFDVEPATSENLWFQFYSPLSSSSYTDYTIGVMLLYRMGLP